MIHNRKEPRNVCYIIATSLMLLSHLVLYAQNVVSPEKVRAKFLHLEDGINTAEYDKMPSMSSKDEYFLFTPQLREAGDMMLPPSVWMMAAHTENKEGYTFKEDPHIYQPKEEQRTLCWMGIREDNPTKEASIRKRLRKEYGSIVSKDGKMEGIPARWFSGTMTFMVGVIPYGGVDLCLIHDDKIKDGILCVGEDAAIEDKWDKKVYFNEDLLEKKPKTLVSQLFELAPELFRGFDDRESTELADRAEMLLLAYEVNKFCPLSFCKSQKIENLPIYVYMRKDGQCEMMVLDDSVLQEVDLQYVEELKSAFSQIPPMPFSLKFTMEGEYMPGRILYATHDGAWTFREWGKKE